MSHFEKTAMYKVDKNIGIRILFLAIFIGYFSDVTFFSHSHIINGVTIVHSHYFHKQTSPGNSSEPVKHTHSNQVLTLISQTNTWNAVILQTPEVPGATQSVLITSFEEKLLPARQFTSIPFYLRGPPAKA